MTVIAQDAHLTAGAWAACGETRFVWRRIFAVEFFFFNDNVKCGH